MIRVLRAWTVGVGIPLVALALLAAPSARADFDTGLAAYQIGDYETARTEWEAAAEEGHAQAQYELGNLYLEGEGVLRDVRKAFAWFEKAAELEHRRAMNAVAQIYRRGQLGERDYAGAAKWYRKAAEKGSPAAIYNMGGLYAEGEGVEQSWVQAYKWFSIAAAFGLDEARAAIFYCTPKMTDEQIAEGDRLALEWRPSDVGP